MLTLIKQAHAAINTGGPITGVGVFQTKADSSQVEIFISTLIGAITVVGGLAFLVFFFLGAIKWITAGGDKAKVQESQAEMINSLIGLIAMVAAYFIVGIVGGLLGIDILNPMTIINNITQKQ